MGLHFSTAAVVGGAFVSGIGLGIYQVWRRTRAPQPFGPQDFAFGIVLGSAMAVPLAAAHGMSAIASHWMLSRQAPNPSAFILLSLVIYLLALHRADQVVRMAGGPRAAAYYLGDELLLFFMSLAIASALTSSS